MSTTDLQALFANIRPKSRDPAASDVDVTASAQSQSTEALGIPTSPPPPFSAVNPQHMPNDSSMNSNENSKNTTNQQNLLNLLNFGSNQPASAQTSTPAKPESARTYSASDLVARMMSPPAGIQPQAVSPINPEDQGGGTPKAAPDSAQAGLLSLLSKAQSKSSKPSSVVEEKPATPVSAEAVATPSQQETGKENQPIFTYTNPFEQLNASRTQTPQVVPTPTKAPQSPIFKDIPLASIETGSEIRRVHSPSEVSARKKLTPRSASARAERLARENSTRSVGTPEPAVKEEGSPAPKMTDLPIRTANNDVKVEAAVVDNGKAAAKASPDAGADEWEDAEESPASDEPRKVPVYNFPIKPFVSIALDFDAPSQVGIRDDGVMEISRLKKEFDQVDRSLAAATTKYIAYALVKNGGIRIIRQDDGTDRQVFKHSGDRVFNVAFCSTAVNSPPLEHQAVLGTGVSGTVYYATVSKDGNDLFEKNELESESLAFPPWPPADENSAGGLLKTRAKRSSRHPEYFAIGRGKSIHIIWPATAMFSKYGISETSRMVDMDKLYQERNLQITTGKAGKDFAFSEDDSLIVSLDKTGRLRFWDIRELTDEANATANKVAPVKVDTPLLSLSTASPAEKSWPTSVLFVDKSRPYTRGGAQRYVLVGLRQNHTLQLWDIALGKAVQELNFPHENETDGICSVNYHPATGIIVVAHPTRNSLFFIHLSAPKYSLNASTTQAAYVQRIAAKDPEVPKPESTACMSGVREISFASKGQLRSIELLPVHKDPKAPKDSDEKTPMFELYVVHSKGVTCLTITKEDLGWDANSKVIDGIDAAKAGIVTLKELKLGSVIEESSTTRSESPVKEMVSSKPSKKKSKKGQQPIETEAVTNAVPPQAEPTAPSLPVGQVNGDSTPQKESKKSKKKSHIPDLQPTVEDLSRDQSPVTKAPISAQENTSAGMSSSGLHLPAREVDQPQNDHGEQSLSAHEPDLDRHATAKSAPIPSYGDEHSEKSEKLSVGIAGDWLDKEMERLKQGIRSEIKKELNSLYRDIQNDRIAQDATATARQESVLRLVSQTLTTNVDRSLGQIVSQQMQHVAIPAFNQVATDAVRSHMNQHLGSTIQVQLSRALPTAVAAAQNDPSASNAVVTKIADQLDRQFKNLANKNEQLVEKAALVAANAVDARSQQFRQQLTQDSQHHAKQINTLTQLVQSVAESAEALAQSQLKMEQKLEQLTKMVDRGQSTTRQVSTSRLSTSPAPPQFAKPTPVKAKTKEELEIEEIQALMQHQLYEEAAMRWIKSGDRVESLFEAVFKGYTPDFLHTDVSSLVALSVALCLASNFRKHTQPRIDYIGTALSAVHLEVSRLLSFLTAH